MDSKDAAKNLEPIKGKNIILIIVIYKQGLVKFPIWWPSWLFRKSRSFFRCLLVHFYVCLCLLVGSLEKLTVGQFGSKLLYLLVYLFSDVAQVSGTSLVSFLRSVNFSEGCRGIE